MITRIETPLFHKLASILYSYSIDDSAVVEAVDALAALHGNDVYDEFFYVLTSKRLGAELSAKYWKKIIPHVETIINPDYRNQGLLPAVLHFMQFEAGLLNSPRFIESDFIDHIVRSSVTDGLTGLYNQTFFKTSLSKLIHQTSRHSLPSFSIVMLDLDNFKEFNDRAGHLAGDYALQRTAAIISEGLRESDISARYGGEEFALLLPHTSRVMARKVAQQIRIAIENEVFAGQEHLLSRNLTISGGIAEFPYDGESADKLIECADAELYKSKTQRNCIYPNGDDRRKNIRHQVRSLVEFVANDNFSFRPGISIDVSESGMLLGCDQNFPVDSNIRLRFNPPYWHSKREVSGTIRQSRKVNELCVLGLEFEQPLSIIQTGILSDIDNNKYHELLTAY